MLTRACISLLLLAAIPAWTQVAPSASGGDTDADQGSEMSVPPSVGDSNFSMTTESEARSNYLNFGIVFTPGYQDNVQPGNGSSPQGDATFAISPSVSFDRAAFRQKATFTYSPNLMIYTPTSTLNSFNQSASASYGYLLSRRASFSLSDTFLRTSDVFTGSEAFSGSGVSGSTQTPTPAAVAPYAEQLVNTVNGDIHYQYTRNGMIGGSGSFLTFSFPNPNQAAGLYNSRSEYGSAYLSRRLTPQQYVGLTYQYGRTLAFAPGTTFEAQTNAVQPLYALFLGRGLTISVSGGILHLSDSATGQPSSGSWSPSGVGSVDWRGSVTSFAASFARTVAAGEGLLGVYKSTRVSGAGRWRITKTWATELSVSYNSISNAAPQIASQLSNTGGNTLAAQATVDHAFNDDFHMTAGYQRLEETYPGIPSIAPDSDRAYVSITYAYRRPLGR
jgi:hypothetical protein